VQIDRQGRQRRLSLRGEANKALTHPSANRATLIVNRQDDGFAKKRDGSDDADPPKCRRNYMISSTARLFPARPSPDIDNLGGSIR
jgi:hypothetical protein